jgi:hypothetical protein
MKNQMSNNLKQNAHSSKVNGEIITKVVCSRGQKTEDRRYHLLPGRVHIIASHWGVAGGGGGGVCDRPPLFWEKYLKLMVKVRDF